MDIEEAGDRPEQIVAELNRQLGDIQPPIPVHDIALALDIIDIRMEALENFEGCLITNDQRTDGEILVNSKSSPPRRRCTVAHELGHFLCWWHRQTNGDGFLCSRSDMFKTANQYDLRDQEVEANRFAIELIAPARFFSRYRRRAPDLEHVTELADKLDISREAAARRYVELHSQPTAVLFLKEGTCRYLSRGLSFPWLAINPGDELPPLPTTSVEHKLSDIVEVDPEQWLGRPHSGELALQVLSQQNDYAIVLLSLDPDVSE